MKRLSNNLLGIFAVGIVGMLSSGSASAQTPQFAQVSPLYFTMPVGSNPLAQALTIVSTGTAFYFNATAQTASGGDWLKVTGCELRAGSSLYTNLTPAVCSVGVSATTLSAGIYAGQVVFSNGSTAITVPVTLTVKGAGVPFFGGVVGALSFVSGNSFPPIPQNIQLTNAGAGALAWTASASTNAAGNVNWLRVSATSGTAPSIIAVSVAAQGLPPGVYLGQILLQAASGNVTIPVSLVVVDSVTNTFQQVPGINFTMPVGSNPLSQTLTLVSTGTAFYFNATAQTAGGGEWLKVTGCELQPGSSLYTSLTPAVCTVSVTAPTLSAGIYAGQVVFNNGSTAVTVPVTLTVKGAGVPFFGGIAGGLSFVSGSSFTPAPQNIQLTNAGNGALDWTASASTFRTNAAGNVNWLSISSSSGTAPSIVTASVSAQGLPSGVYLGQIVFQAASGSVSVPVSLVVVDSVTNTFQQLPGINFTTPVGSNPLAQILNIVSTGTAFYFNATAQTAGGGDWLKVTGCELRAGNSLYTNLTPAVCSVGVNATTLSVGIYAGQVVFSNGSTAMTVPVTLTVGNPFAPSIGVGGIVPVFSSASTIQPGEWVSIYGRNLATGTVTWNGDFPISLGGTSVTINGKKAYLWYVSPGQLNVQSPDDTARGIVSVVVTTANGSATSTVTLGEFGPSFLLLDDKHVTGIILRSNGSGAFGGGSYDIVGPTGSSLGYPTVAAKPGDNMALFGVGFGRTNPVVAPGQAFSGAAPTLNPVTLLVNGRSVTPSFAGLSGAGLFQINLTVPPGLGTGDLSFQAIVGGVQTQAGVVISLQ